MDRFVKNPDGLLVPGHLLAPGRATVFCDESGNTGPNYVDPAQPFYVLAGWLVPEAQVVEVAVQVEEFRKRNFHQRDEVKSSVVLRTDGGKRKCAELFGTLGQLGCLPIYLIAEKRYCVAAKIVETFLDPEYHDLLRSAFTWDTESKQEIANTLYDRLSQAVVLEFANAYRSPDSTSLEKALNVLAETVQSCVSPELAQAFEGCRRHMKAIAESEAETSPLGDVAATLNMPCLVSFLMLVENLARVGVARPIRILHDRQHAYEEGYQRIFRLHRGLPRLFAKLPNSELTFSALEHVAEFEVRDSKSTVPIQAADLLAGAVAHCCKLAARDDPPTDADLELARTILPGLLVPEPRLTWIVSSDHFQVRLGRILAGRDTSTPPSNSGGPTDTRLEVPSHDTAAPVFPVCMTESAPDDLTRVPIDLPLYALRGTHNGGLMVLNNADPDDAAVGNYLLLFTRRDLADQALTWWAPDELTQPQAVATFGPPELPHFIELLWDASKLTNHVAFDLGTSGPLKLAILEQFTEDLDRRLKRIARIFGSGLDRVMLQRHQVGTVEALTVQLRDGRYGAMIGTNSKIYFAPSREEAMAKLREGERL